MIKEEIPKIVIYKGERFGIQSNGRYYQAYKRPTGVERLLHRRVWVNNRGPIPKGHHVHHKNGNWWDNRLKNLECIEGVTHQRKHMLIRMLDPDYKSRSIAELRRASPLAVAWHKSKEGIAWHAQHGKKTWVGRKKDEVACTVCGSKVETFFKTRKRFCSKSCQQKVSYQSHKTSKANCVLCSLPFLFNKYRKQECCSRKCGIRLRVKRSKELNKTQLRGIPST